MASPHMEFRLFSIYFERNMKITFRFYSMKGKKRKEEKKGKGKE